MIESCNKCLKPESLCFCSEIHPVANKTSVLILQHPQEPDHELGTAKIAQLALANSQLKIGLSWKNLKSVLGKEANPSQWLVFYLGSGSKGEPQKKVGIQYLSKKGLPVSKPTSIQGIVFLDGTWSQSKALWWRNPWLLKLQRAILIPQNPSKYGNLRKEPRKECLSTLESIAGALSELGESPEVSSTLIDHLETLLRKYREAKK